MTNDLCWTNPIVLDVDKDKADSLFINPVIGRKKKGDFKDEVILASYEELIRNYYLNEKTYPHPASDHINFSGSKIKEMLLEGKIPPPELMRPEVAKIIISFDHPFIE